MCSEMSDAEILKDQALRRRMHGLEDAHRHYQQRIFEIEATFCNDLRAAFIVEASQKEPVLIKTKWGVLFA